MSTTTQHNHPVEHELRDPRESTPSNGSNGNNGSNGSNGHSGIGTEPVAAKPTLAPPKPKKKPKKKSSRKIWWIVALLIVGAAVVGTAYAITQSFGSSDQNLVLYTVKRGDLIINVSERGTLESQKSLEITCEVDDIEGDDVRGATIRWLIPNGSSVKKDDPLVEFESTGHQERVDRQILAHEQARKVQIQAKAKYDNQITQNETTEADAARKVKLAELELKMFKDPNRGTHKLEVEEINRLIDGVNNEIVEAEAQLELAKRDKMASESLFKLGYAGKSELDKSRLALLKAEGVHAAAMAKLETQLATLQKKETYEREMQLLTFDGNVETAKQALVQIKRDNEALLEQAKAELDNANNAYKKETERLERYKQSLANCKIVAPTDGMIAYAVADSKRWWMEEIRPGSSVRKRQRILSIPNLKLMQVRTSVHESVIDQIKKGLKASIRIQAFSDTPYKGVVKRVAVLANQQSAETKVYDTIVVIEGEVDQLKPGMTAVVEIHVDKLDNVLTVPVQAIVQVRNDTWVYVKNGKDTDRRKVVLGKTNHKFVEIISGIEAGEEVVLNPMAIVDNEDKKKDDKSKGGQSK